MIDSTSLIHLAFAIARVTLRERARRRKLISVVLGVFLLVFVIGSWPLAGWLGESPWAMLFWLLACSFLGISLAGLALYDGLSVVREEREKLGLAEEKKRK